MHNGGAVYRFYRTLGVLTLGVLSLGIWAWPCRAHPNMPAAHTPNEQRRPAFPARTPAPPEAPTTPPSSRGRSGFPNPARGHFVPGTAADPLAAFSRRPLEKFIIPEGGLFLDPSRDPPHYGVDYANPEDYLNRRWTYVYPLGPGYVTARSTCIPCYVDGGPTGRVEWRWPRYNFGWGNLVLVETPYNAHVSIYVLYAHLARDLVSLGDYVTPQAPLGVVGTTGYSQTYHVHVEVRYGPPGLFWNADFTQWETLDRWMSTLFVNPAWLVFPDNHPAFVAALETWTTRHRSDTAIP